MQKIKILIYGMHCASCANNVEKSLKKIKGIKQASVNAMTKKGFIEADDSVKEEDLKKAVERAGYKIVSIEKNG